MECFQNAHPNAGGSDVTENQNDSPFILPWESIPLSRISYFCNIPLEVYSGNYRGSYSLDMLYIFHIIPLAMMP